jgi:hypothetical protein
MPDDMAYMLVTCTRRMLVDSKANSSNDLLLHSGIIRVV